jgi:ribose 5-phosphate isomerase A
MQEQALSADLEAMKRDAAIRAAERIEDGMTLGLGTGSTVRYLIDHVAELRAGGQLRGIVAVPTSRATEEHALRLGIPLGTLADHREVDLTIDGADEVDPQLHLIKGLGGALLREKVVASVSRAFVVIVDESKLVDRLGTRGPLPVEVDPFAAPVIAERLRAYGADPALRRDPSGLPFVSDGGHHILDCAFSAGIQDAAALERSFRSHPGVLETGLFLGMTSAVVVAGAEGVRVLEGEAG